MSGKSLGILGVLTLVVVGIAVALSMRHPPPIQGVDQPLFPNLVNNINQVDHITIQGTDGTVNIVHNDNQWRVKEKDGYPAAVDRIRQLLLGMAGLTRIEPKTRSPDLYSKIGVRDVAKKGSKAKLVEIKNAGDTTTAALLVGNQMPDKADPTQKEYFVRKPGDAQSWLVSGNLLVETAPKQWLDSKLLDIDQKRIHKVIIRREDGKEITVYKNDPAATDFQIAGMPHNAKVKSTFTVNSLATTMGRLSVDDVFRPADLKLAGKPLFVATMETFDGLRLRLKALSDKTDRNPQYVELSAEYDAGLAESNAPKAKPDKKSAAAKPLDVEKEARDLNEKFKPWIYKLPPYQIANLNKKEDDLISIAKQTPPHKASHQAKKPVAGATKKP